MHRNDDNRIDIPSGSNREKHINFRDTEEKITSENSADENRFGSSKEDAERRRQWQEGLEEGRKISEQNHD